MNCNSWVSAKDEDLKKMRWCQSSEKLKRAVQFYLFQGAIKDALWTENIRAYNHQFGYVSNSQAFTQKNFLKRLTFWILRKFQSEMRQPIFPKEILKIILDHVVNFSDDRNTFVGLKFFYNRSGYFYPFYPEKCCKNILGIAKLQRTYPLFSDGIGNRIYDIWFNYLYINNLYLTQPFYGIYGDDYSEKEKALIKFLLQERSDMFNNYAMMNPTQVPSNVSNYLSWWPNHNVYQLALKRKTKIIKNEMRRERRKRKKSYQKCV